MKNICSNVCNVQHPRNSCCANGLVLYRTFHTYRFIMLILHWVCYTNHIYFIYELPVKNSKLFRLLNIDNMITTAHALVRCAFCRIYWRLYTIATIVLFNTSNWLTLIIFFLFVNCDYFYTHQLKCVKPV